jgi:hypothetical protein
MIYHNNKQELTTTQRLGLASLIIKVKAWEIENKTQLEIIARKEISDKTKLNVLTKSLAETVRSFGKFLKENTYFSRVPSWVKMKISCFSNYLLIDVSSFTYIRSDI